MIELHHDNVNTFIGACVDTVSPFVLFLYCRKGSLQVSRVLRDNRFILKFWNIKRNLLSYQKLSYYSKVEICQANFETVLLFELHSFYTFDVNLLYRPRDMGFSFISFCFLTNFELIISILCIQFMMLLALLSTLN